MGRAPCCDKANVKKGPWSPEEDAKLKAYIEQYGTGGNWIALPQKIGLKRCGKSCRLRWLNYLRPNIKHGGFSEEEDSIICSLYISIGSRWSIIAAQLPGRTDNDIKNYWNTRLKKKLLGKQQREQQALSRRIHSLKQETTVKKDDKNFSILSAVSMINHQTPYFPEPAVAIQVANSSGQDLRDLLMKMGGRFSETTATCSPAFQLNPVEVSQTQNPFFESSNFVQFADMQFGVNSLQDPAVMFHGVENSCSPGPGGDFGEAAGYRDPLQNLDGLEGFYGMGNMIAGGSVGSSSAESSSLGEMSSMVYPPLVSSDFEACQQSMPHNVAAFADSTHYCLQ